MKELNKIKVYVVGNSIHYKDFIKGNILVPRIIDADVVIFTGGEDVNPELYEDITHSTTYINKYRDQREVVDYAEALKHKKLMLGICRGSQFLTVMAGGSLIQDVRGHGLAGQHLIQFEDGETMGITSTHHQMMYPFNMKKDEYEIIAKSYQILSDYHYNGSGQDIDMVIEPEIVHYPKIRALAIQGHPEYMDKESKIVVKINVLIDNLLNDLPI